MMQVEPQQFVRVNDAIVLFIRLYEDELEGGRSHVVHSMGGNVNLAALVQRLLDGRFGCRGTRDRSSGNGLRNRLRLGLRSVEGRKVMNVAGFKIEPDRREPCTVG